MNPTRLLFLALLSFALIAAACGGDDDDDDDGGDDSDSSSSSSSQNRSKGVPNLKVTDGGLTGSITVDITGDRKEKLEMDGAGVAQSGAAYVSFAKDTASLQLVLSSGNEPGGMALNSKEVSTAGAWGEGCDININDSASELKGDFTCKNIDAVTAGSLKAFKINVTGKFSLKR